MSQLGRISLLDQSLERSLILSNREPLNVSLLLSTAELRTSQLRSLTDKILSIEIRFES